MMYEGNGRRPFARSVSPDRRPVRPAIRRDRAGYRAFVREDDGGDATRHAATEYLGWPSNPRRHPRESAALTMIGKTLKAWFHLR
jgi:hypothetical protein